ncbi:riboflavin synthase [Niabella drilacis]|uniref:Riboflavin synthase n=1 Tax=Niabella drilacis (strain DSM 25811 / CCM 8410 / CCUG 62505 / LMG 26954 / E90) TaxID=1285928 RepID=A0A1G6U588_NIADE|nr:riboflavin synthase [Niabella drilacis]SDD36592.1 riboflavin synthase alpha chain [Niabella drilacis]
MFTGIIEAMGTVISRHENGKNITFWIGSTVSKELKVDQSISHNGVCLTVEAVEEDRHQVTAIAETLEVSNLGHWQAGTLVNLERCMLMNGRLDGHIVQGHVDGKAICRDIVPREGSTEYTIEFDRKFAPMVIEKGSISLNGISLTVFDVTGTTFTVAIIPYTLAHTNMGQLQKGAAVNLEFDVIGKYILRSRTLD